MAEPYPPKVQNCLRLFCLLINKGTPTLQRVCEDYIKKITKGSTIEVYLNQGNIKSKMRQDLERHQLDLVYPKKGPMAKERFDLSLWCKLLENLQTYNGHGTYYNEIKTVRYIRNGCYGHLPKLEMTDHQLEKVWKNLEQFLIKYGCSKKEIDEMRTGHLDPDMVEYCQQEIESQTERDTKAVQAIASMLIDLMENHADSLKQTSLESKVDTILNSLRSVKESDDCSQLVVNVKNVLTEMESSLVDILMKSSTESTESIKNEIQQYTKSVVKSSMMLQEQQEKMYSVQKKMTEDMLQVKEQMESIDATTLAIHEKLSVTPEETLNYLAFERVLNDTKDSFKVLVINQPEKCDESSKKLFCHALGCVPWDIILDLDHTSRTDDGFFDEIAKTYRDVKDFKVCTYSTTKIITEPIQESIANGQLALWFQANGCAVKNIESCADNFSKSKTKVTNILDNVMCQLPTKKSLLTIGMVLSEEMLSPINDLLHRAKEAAESNVELFNTNSSHTLIFNMTDRKLDLKNTSDLFNYIQTDGTLRMVASLLQKTHSIKPAVQYIFPGLKGSCVLHGNEMAMFKGILTLYHQDIGLLDIDNMEEDEVEDIFSKIRLNYVKGNELSPQALFVHEQNFPVYVERREMKELRIDIEKNLEDRKTLKSSWPFVLQHNASGGGTTAVRYVMYHMRKKYPCFLIMKITEEMIEWLKHIFLQSKLPLLLVIDTSQYTKQDAISLQYKLNNSVMKALVVYLERCAPEHFKESANEAQMDTYNLPSKITYHEDKLAFNTLFKVNKKQVSVNKVFLFGLLYFCEDANLKAEEYSRLQQHILTCNEEATDWQKTILKILCLIGRYSNRALKEQLVWRYLASENIDAKCKSLLDNLGYAADFIVAKDDGLKLAHSRIIESIVQVIIGEDTSKQYTAFVQCLCGLLDIDSEKKHESTNLIVSILVHRQKGNDWSKFVLDLQNDRTLGAEFVVEMLNSIIEIHAKYETNGLSHLQMLLARYMMYVIEKPDFSIEIMKRALKMKSGETIMCSDVADQTLLNTYGYLLRENVKRKLRERKASHQFNKKEFMEFATNEIREAIDAFKRAQGSTRNYLNGQSGLYAANSFVGEARVRALLLRMFFDLVCESDHQRFASYMEESDDPFIKDCERGALESLEKMEMLREIGRLYEDDLFRTLQLAHEARYDLLTLHYDKNSVVSHVLKKLPDNVPFDVGKVIRSGANRLNEWSSEEKPWNKLKLAELDQMIKYLMKRVKGAAALRCNFRDMIYALIHARQLPLNQTWKKKLQKYNIDLALQCAYDWVLTDKNDIEAIFLYGLLKLVIGFQDKSNLKVQEALGNLEKSRQLCEKQHKTFFNHYKKRYAIGPGPGLEAIVPYHHELDKNDLATFEGRQIGKYVLVRPFEPLFRESEFKVTVEKSEHTISSAHQEPLVNFKMVLSFVQIVATDCNYENTS